jgi:hypothetical protein
LPASLNSLADSQPSGLFVSATHYWPIKIYVQSQWPSDFLAMIAAVAVRGCFCPGTAAQKQRRGFFRVKFNGFFI